MRIRLGCVVAIVLSVLVAVATAEAQKKTLVIGAEPGSGHPGSHARPHLRGAHHLRADVREALRDRREPEDPPPARGGAAGVLRRRQDGHDQAAHRREVQRRHADERRGHEVLARSPPRDEGLEPPERAGPRRRGGGRGSGDGPAQAEGAVLPDHGASSPTAPACRCRRPRPGSSTTSSGPRRCASGPGRSPSAWPRTGSCWRSPPTTSIRAQAKFDRLVFRIIPDDNVRLANLRSGDIDFMHLVTPTDAASLKKEGKFEVASVTGHRLPRASTSTCGTRPARPQPARRPRHARSPTTRGCARRSSCRIDREALNQVVWEGQYTPDCTPISPVSPFYDKSRKCPGARRRARQEAPGRRGARQRLHLRAHGVRTSRRSGGWARSSSRWPRRPASTSRSSRWSSPPRWTRTTRRQAPGVPDRLERARRSGRQHPPVPHVQGQPQHDAGVRRDRGQPPEQGARGERPEGARGPLQQAIDRITARRNVIYLYHLNYIVAYPKNLKGYKAVPDGLIRIKGASWN